jgi:hypothetical protein
MQHFYEGSSRKALANFERASDISADKAHPGRSHRGSVLVPFLSECSERTVRKKVVDMSSTNFVNFYSLHNSGGARKKQQFNNRSISFRDTIFPRDSRAIGFP